MIASATMTGHQGWESVPEPGAYESIFTWGMLSSGMDIAEIEVTMSLKGIDRSLLDRLLDSTCAESLEEIDVLTLRSFLHYLRSL